LGAPQKNAGNVLVGVGSRLRALLQQLHYPLLKRLFTITCAEQQFIHLNCVLKWIKAENRTTFATDELG
jgi:hypothetical protein